MKINIMVLVAGMAFMAGCSTELDVDVPTFDVTVESTTIKAGEMASFTFKGETDNVWFYSGELRKDYTYKDGRVIDVSGSGAKVAFTSAVSGGAQQNQLSVLYSTNFNGDYSDLSKVKAATWTDITGSFKLGTTATFLSSDSLDISDWLVKGKPIYFAFKYVTRPQATNGLARTWMVQNFSVTSKQKLGNTSLIIYDQVNAGFRIVDENPENAPARSVITTTRITLLGNIYKSPDHEEYVPDSQYNDPQSENWAVSTPIVVDKVDLGTDLSIAVKSKETRPTGYVYKYTTPGTYKAYFVASNSSIDAVKQVVKEFEITVTP